MEGREIGKKEVGGRERIQERKDERVRLSSLVYTSTLIVAKPHPSIAGEADQSANAKTKEPIRKMH